MNLYYKHMETVLEWDNFIQDITANLLKKEIFLFRCKYPLSLLIMVQLQWVSIGLGNG